MSQMELLDIQQTADLLKLSVATVRLRLYERRRGVGDFPQPISGFKRKCFWLRSEIERYVERLNEQANPFPLQEQRKTSAATKHGLSMP